jgi:hypothetical protein
MKPTPNKRVLDVGGEVNPRCDRLLQFVDGCPWKSMLSTVNISPDHVRQLKDCYAQVDVRRADACDLPWPDKYFDVVHGNAVIEHIGDFKRQRRMAQEIMRVGKAWFVATPNRWYPFELHTRLPLVTWLPGHGYIQCARLMKYSHARKRYVFGTKAQSNLRLLGARQLARCFPGSRIIRQRVTILPETLIAVGRDSDCHMLQPYDRLVVLTL